MMKVHRNWAWETIPSASCLVNWTWTNNGDYPVEVTVIDEERDEQKATMMVIDSKQTSATSES